jgi:hypothetical protein
MPSPEVLAIEVTVGTILLDHKHVHPQPNEGVPFVSGDVFPRFGFPHLARDAPKLGTKKGGRSPLSNSVSVLQSEASAEADVE